MPGRSNVGSGSLGSDPTSRRALLPARWQAMACARRWVARLVLLGLTLSLWPPAAAAERSAPVLPLPLPTAAPTTGTATADPPIAATAEPPPRTVQLVPQPVDSGAVLHRFTLGPKVTEFLVIVHSGSLAGVRLRTPAGQLISADNIWRVGRWQTGERMSVISLDWATPGTWMLLGPEPAPVSVIADAMLVPLATPESNSGDGPIELRWQLQAGGRAIDLATFADLVVASARLIDERGGSTALGYELRANGELVVTVPPQPPGVVTVEASLWLATFGQHVVHRLATVPAPSVALLGRRSAPTVVVRLADAALDRQATRVVARIVDAGGAAQAVLGKRGPDGAFRLTLPDGAVGAGARRIALVIEGRTKGGQPWQAPTRWLDLNAPGRFDTVVEEGAPSRPPGVLHDAPSATARGDGTNDDPQAAADQGVAALLLAQLRGEGEAPPMWAVVALATANLLLIGLFWQRHRLRVRQLAGQSSGPVHAPAQSTMVDDDDARADDSVLPRRSVAAEPTPAETSDSGATDAAADPDTAIAIEPLIADDEALGALAALAEEGAEARGAARSKAPLARAAV